MKTVVLHIGMPKTATTTLQQAFSNNSNKNREKDLLYPRCGRFEEQAAHHAFFFSFLGHEGRKKLGTPIIGSVPALQVQFGQLEQEIVESDAKTILMSSESLWIPTAYDENVLEGIKACFSRYDIHILASLRSIPSHARSSYIQRVVGPQSYCGSFENHVSTSYKSGMWDYAQRLSVFSKVFGDNAVRVFWYEDALEDIFKPYTTFLGLDDTFASQLTSGSEWLNRAKEWQTVQSALVRNRMKKSTGPVIGRILAKIYNLSRVAGWKVDERLQMSTETEQFLIQLQTGQSELISSRYNCNWF